MLRVCLLAFCILGLGAGSANAATVMACGSKFRQHPSSCAVGSGASGANFTSLKWRGWGKPIATARGRQTANHRDRDGSLPRYRTTVQVGGLDFCDGRSVYTQIRFKTSWPDQRARYSEWLALDGC
ncbi:hypothetical protein DVA67_028220 [Solirubrobacter sp. CPCC 204708]|uniref:Secreted protein n=1 Tax=Solirubrobacter deserti TaxID=2282478 RepID=A0ABT4RS48_9ACTN|nr:hypothetical protein [Solirubrobacter deserti]MBE2319884.1 hypothetical protein [Solirubrobacter deserti]MDA0141417.1 hypothetical protein [Solirubrobacter deserti]